MSRWFDMKPTNSIKREILSQIHKNGSTTASKINYSNANQYLIYLEIEGLIIRKWANNGFKTYKEARINPSRLDEVKEYLGVEL
jgi:hypothetical protein